jgi:hypothetical protein
VPILKIRVRWKNVSWAKNGRLVESSEDEVLEREQVSGNQVHVQTQMKGYPGAGGMKIRVRFLI